MDPNAALEIWRDKTDPDASRDAFLALREWLSKGGFEPEGLTESEKIQLGMSADQGGEEDGP